MNEIQEHYYLTDIIGTKVTFNGKRIGTLSDLAIHAEEKTGEIEHICVSRRFGDPSLFIPWKFVSSFDHTDIKIDVSDIKNYEIEPTDHDVLLKDQVVDKRIIDIKENEVEVVYDIKLTLKEGRLFITDVDLSKFRMFKRLGLRAFGKILQGFAQFFAGKMQEKTISWNFIQPLPTRMGPFKGDIKLNILKENLSAIHPIDLAHILEEMSYYQRSTIFKQLTLSQASQTLEAIDPSLQRSIVESLTKENTLELFDLMTPGQIADVLSSLPWDMSSPLIQLLDDDTKIKIQAMLEKQDQYVENLITRKIIKCHKNDLVKEIQDAYPSLAKHKDVTMYLYIVNDDEQLIGVVDIMELLEADEAKILKDIMKKNLEVLKQKSTYKEAAELFAKYDFRAIPVVDAHKKLLGAIRYKDLVKFKKRFIN
jgi:CBS domain-containing protein/sporulation protein YlmC with PRC-barrel domain